MPPAVVVAVRVKPGVSRAYVGGRYDGQFGPALIVAVNAPAVDGRATAAVGAALAGALGLKTADIALKTGARSKDKLFTVHNPPSDLDDRLAVLYER